MEEPKLVVSGSGSGRKRRLEDVSQEQIAALKRQYVDSALDNSTIAAYKSLLVHYTNYCQMIKALPWPASMSVIEDCTTWLIYSGTPSSASNLWSAIKYMQQKQGFSDLVKSSILQKLHVKALKITAQQAKPLRDPLPVEAIVAFCNSGDQKSFAFIQKAALVTTGCRVLLRYNEVAKLKMKDIVFDEKFATIDPGIRKNAKERAPFLYIEKSLNNTNSCPYTWLKRHIQCKLMQGAKPDDLVFRSKRGKKISYNDVKNILVEVAKIGKCTHLNISSHSMRVTGAVMMMMAGFDNLQIQLMGDWKSQIFLRYLRTIGIAALKATTRMGL
jgi:site-specific recombinase XerD